MMASVNVITVDDVDDDNDPIHVLTKKLESGQISEYEFNHIKDIHSIAKTEENQSQWVKLLDTGNCGAQNSNPNSETETSVSPVASPHRKKKKPKRINREKILSTFPSASIESKYTDLESIGRGATSTIFRATRCAYNLPPLLPFGQMGKAATLGGTMRIAMSDARSQEWLGTLRRNTRNPNPTLADTFDTTNNLVALKRFKTSLAGPENNEEDLADIIAEIAILKRCNQENVLGFTEAFVEDGRVLWVATSLCIGSCFDVLAVLGRTFHEHEILGVICQLLCGLEYLHSKKIIHRDLKCANFLFDEDGRVIIADFGVSTDLSTEDDEVCTTFVGSPYWIAPEVITAMDTGGYTYSADVWSMGITMLEMAHGEPPLMSMNAMSALYQIPSKDPPTLDPSKGPWSSDFQDLTRRCLQKNANKRYTAEELQQHDALSELRSSCNGRSVVTQLVASAFTSKPKKKKLSSSLFEGVDEPDSHSVEHELQHHHQQQHHQQHQQQQQKLPQVQQQQGHQVAAQLPPSPQLQRQRRQQERDRVDTKAIVVEAIVDTPAKGKHKKSQATRVKHFLQKKVFFRRRTEDEDEDEDTRAKRLELEKKAVEKEQKLRLHLRKMRQSSRRGRKNVKKNLSVT